MITYATYTQTLPQGIIYWRALLDGRQTFSFSGKIKHTEKRKPAISLFLCAFVTVFDKAHTQKTLLNDEFIYDYIDAHVGIYLLLLSNR